MKSTLQLLLPLFIWFSFISCQSSASDELSTLRENTFPSFEEIYTHVNKQITSKGKDCYFSLSKKSDGYYLRINFYQQDKESKFLKAWDAETKKHLTLQLEPYLSDKSGYGTYKNGLANVRYQDESYDLNYLFAYPNYTHDLINLFKDREDLSLRELEMLARAYSEEACDFIHPNQGGIEVSESKDLAERGYDKIEASRISSFLRLSEQSLACYKKIQQKDPAYRSIIFDDVNLKVNHDLMNNYLLLNSVKENELAAGMLGLVKYKADAIAYAKELLINCAENGVLFTAGDSDTFPLWYVQETMGFRKDVLVVNHSLLQATWYLDFIRNKTALKSSLSQDEYQFYTHAYILTSGEREPAPSFTDWLDLVKTSKIPKLNNPKQILGLEEMPKTSSNVKLSIHGSEKILFLNRGYLEAVDFCILDLINSNKEHVFYATSPATFTGSPLFRYFAKRNLIFELTASETWDYTDKQSMPALEKAIRANRIDYSVSSKTIIKNIIFSRFNDWTNPSEDQINDPKPLFDLFIKQLHAQKHLNENDYEFAEKYAASLKRLDKTKAQPFVDSYTPKVIALIESVDNQKLCTKKDAEMLESIFNMYRENYSMKPGSVESEKQLKVISTLKQKVKMLCDNPVNTKNLSWTLEILERLKHELAPY